MLVLGSLIVVIIITVIFYFLNPKKYKWWEFFIPLLATLLAVIVSKVIIEKNAVSFTEYWGSSISYIVEEEPWNEWIYKTCTESYPCGTDSDGNTKYCTRTYDCSYQEDHGPKWYCITTIGEDINISEKQHDKLIKQFTTPKNIIKTRRNHSSRDWAVHSKGTKFENMRVGKTSNVYKTEWNKTDDTRQAVATKHKYENRIKTSDLSLFNIAVVTDQEADSLGLYKYPTLKDNLNYPTILGGVDEKTQDMFQKLNGKFGPTNQLRLWILLFENKPSIYGQYQENYWVSGNKNELVICIGLKNNEIQWSHAFSWSTSSTFTAEVKNKVLDLYEYQIITKNNKTIPIPITDDLKNILNKLNNNDSLFISTFKNINILPILGFDQDNILELKKSHTPILSEQTWLIFNNYLNNNLHKFERRSFEEFNYVKVNPSRKSIIFIYIFALIISLGINIWATYNNIEE
jgi:hypothetical protein